MNCGESERLFDAYLDGQLTGTLRLEFDAHRLRCRHCQQTLAMLESCAHLIASDRRGPSLSADFTERVMAAVSESAAPRGRRLTATRAAFVAGAVLQAAAVVMFAVWLDAGRSLAPRPAAPPGGEALMARPVGDIREMFYDTLEKYLSASDDLTAQGRRVAQYLNISVPDPVARAVTDPTTLNPLLGWTTVLPPAVEGGAELEEADPTQFDL